MVMGVYPFIEELRVAVEPFIMGECTGRSSLIALRIVCIDYLISKHVSCIVAEHVAEFVLIELEEELHPCLIG